MSILIVEILCVAILVMTLASILIDERRKRRGAMRPVKLKGYWDGANRRSAKRLNIPLDVRYTIGGKSANAKSVDISSSGIRLLLDERAEAEAVLHLEINIPDRGQIIKLRGEVVWSKESIENEKGSAKRLFATGIKFVKSRGDTEKTLFDFIHRQK